jgi:hypothetical protein
VAVLTDEEILERYQAGFPPSKIANYRACRLNAEEVRALLRERGVEKAFRPGRPAKALDEGDVCSRHRSGEPVSRIARSLAVHAERVTEILEKHQVPITRSAWGPFHPRWKGGRSIEKRTGYVRVTLSRDDPFRAMADKNGALWEHRYVMATYLGRPLTSRESVHHVDGDRQHNALENLQLRIGNHGVGARFRCNACGSNDIAAEEL